MVSSIIDELGTWKTPKQKIEEWKSGPDELAEVLINTQKQYWGESDQTHHWYIFGHGSKLLDKALSKVEQLGHGGLSHHEFSFIEPRTNLGAVLDKIDRLGGHFNKTLSLKSIGAKFHQALDADATVAGLQAHDKSWTDLDQKLRPSAALLQKVDSVVQGVSANPQQVASFSSKNFVALVDKLSESLAWG
ncbi:MULTISPECIES: hypothetical protein [Microbulbifer]|uniref:Uncharacterized protein n=1 Tax=Microbulbifer celer TaxID=435905 RepID=A0ABW3U908_9GAMM|nr:MULTISPECIES: hypothetical protein [Microbulbifer]UFN56701.1 hypothetical protein LPW13_14155 [Microbulbifer celer]